MNKVSQLLVILSVICLATSQIVNLSQIYTPSTLKTLGPQYSDTSFIKLIDNFFGCKTWINSTCTECSASYYFNDLGICCQIDEYCQQFNRNVGICQFCYTGYYLLSNGSCSLSNITNTGCQQWNNTQCTLCSVRYYFNNQNICVPVNDQCRTWNANGICNDCYNGYIVNNGTCVLNPNPPIVQSIANNPLCKTWNNTVCLQCTDRAYFDTNGICQPVSDNCNTWDRLDGLCLTCYQGYQVVNGSCTLAAAPSIDPGCVAWSNSTCIKCSQNWVFNSLNVCVQVSDGCKTSDSVGACTSCYVGYIIQNSSCVLAPVTGPTDAGCQQWNGSVCVTCAPYWVFNALNLCIPVSSSCKTYSGIACTSCYVGYDLTNGSCLYSIKNTQLPSDGGCKNWDFVNAKCIQCSSSWVFDSNGLCIPVNDQCRTYDNTGACTGCYLGYQVQNQTCVVSSAPSIDSGCKIFNWTTLSCLNCSNRWYFNSQGACTPVNTQCSTYDQSNGDCLTCYLGYNLINGSCVLAAQSGPSDPGCALWNGSVCVQCSPYWTFDANKICVQVSTLCKTYNGLACTSCFIGYSLVNGSCIMSATSLPTDAGCANWNWTAGICLNCSEFWYFSNGVCTPVNALCSSYNNTTGECLTCYKGYSLTNGSCILSSSIVPKDAGCSDWNWDSQICLNCSQNWFMSNGTCQQVSPYCKTHDNSGLCTSCYSGYSLSNGVCSTLQTLCQTANGTICLSCYTGYALYQGQCVPLNSLADIALYYAACCPQKLADLQAQGRIPK